MNILSIVIAILVFSILVIIHEFGHFLLAKKNGIYVIEFSVGMGPRLLSFKKGETRYSLKLVPFGGSCAMLGEDALNEENELEEGYDMERAFHKKGVWARISVVAAGPIFNFILAFVMALIVIGFAGTDPAFVNDVEEGSPAAEAGLQAGDVITKYNGHSISVGRDIYLEEYLHPVSDEKIDLTVERAGTELDLTIQPVKKETAYLGMRYSSGTGVASVDVVEDGPMEKAGIISGDIIKKINNVVILDSAEIGEYLKLHPLTGEPVTIQVERDGAIMDFQVTPGTNTYYYTGFNYNSYKVKGENLDVTVDTIEEEGAAAKAGLKKGDRIVTVNGKEVLPGMATEINRWIQDSEGKALTLEVERGDQEKQTLTITPEDATEYKLGMTGYTGAGNSTEVEVAEDSAMADAGMQSGDLVVSVNGVKVADGQALQDYLDSIEISEEPLTFVYTRAGKEYTAVVTPKPVALKKYSMGFTCSYSYSGNSGFRVIGASFTEIGYQVRTVFKSLGALVTGKLGVDDMAGPVGIVDVISDTVNETKSEGWWITVLTLMNFIILLSANLAVMNLLPLPALDGGRLVFLLIEAVRGKPVDREKEGMVHFVGMILLMILMVFILYNDIMRLFQ